MMGAPSTVVRCSARWRRRTSCKQSVDSTSLGLCFGSTGPYVTAEDDIYLGPAFRGSQGPRIPTFKFASDYC